MTVLTVVMLLAGAGLTLLGFRSGWSLWKRAVSGEEQQGGKETLWGLFIIGTFVGLLIVWLCLR